VFASRLAHVYRLFRRADPWHARDALDHRLADPDLPHRLAARRRAGDL